jgi:hypothetical protein
MTITKHISTRIVFIEKAPLKIRIKEGLQYRYWYSENQIYIVRNFNKSDLFTPIRNSISYFNCEESNLYVTISNDNKFNGCVIKKGDCIILKTKCIPINNK